MAPPIPRPITDTPAARALCEELVPGAAPGLVEVNPPPWAKTNDCFPTVVRVIEEFGGTMECGWTLWETLPGVMIEAEFHAVWKSDEGHRVDVTPKAFRVDRIAFLPDPTLVYEGRQIDNVRRPLVDDVLVARLINEAEAYYEATNRGDLADYHGMLKLTPEMKAIRTRMAQLHLKILQKYFM